MAKYMITVREAHKVTYNVDYGIDADSLEEAKLKAEIGDGVVTYKQALKEEFFDSYGVVNVTEIPEAPEEN